MVLMALKSIESVNCEHNSLIRRQFVKIESLESEIALLRLERDALASDNERLSFQLQCYLQGNSEKKVEPKEPKERTVTSLKASHSQSALSSQTRDYELSNQLLEKRIENLERKYGGLQAREAATRIQRAFRTYRLQKRFKTIAFQALRQTSKSAHAPEKEETRVERVSDADSVFVTCYESAARDSHALSSQQTLELQRKRRYRVGLNLFNKQPSERGIQFLMNEGFIERVTSEDEQAEVLARFLLSRKGVSKAMIGEYLSSNRDFNKKVLKAFVSEMDFSSQPIDSALRRFQTFFRFPGEAQKIERLVDSFATQYTKCNSSQSLSRDSAFILSFAIIMLNTDLHSKTNQKNRMTANQWLQNLRGVFKEDEATPLSQDYLLEIYQRIRSQELRTGADHVTQVQKVQQALIGQSRGHVVPNLCLESRRLVCYCRLYEVKDKQNKSKDKERHQREVFLFNDLLLVTKLSPRASRPRVHSLPEYFYRFSLSLDGLSVHLFKTQKYLFGIDIKRRVDDACVLSFNARNELDQKRFAEDLKESISETDEMEQMRIAPRASSLLSLEARAQEPEVRRKSSSGSLDSGLSLPSRDHSPQQNSNKSN